MGYGHCRTARQISVHNSFSRIRNMFSEKMRFLQMTVLLNVCWEIKNHVCCKLRHFCSGDRIVFPGSLRWQSVPDMPWGFFLIAYPVNSPFYISGFALSTWQPTLRQSWKCDLHSRMPQEVKCTVSSFPVKKGWVCARGCANTPAPSVKATVGVSAKHTWKFEEIRFTTKQIKYR